MMETIEHLAETITVTPTAPPGANKIMQLVSWVAWGATIAAVGAMMWAGGKFGWDRHQGSAGPESATKVGYTLLGCVVIAVAGAVVGTLTS